MESKMTDRPVIPPKPDKDKITPAMMGSTSTELSPPGIKNAVIENSEHNSDTAAGSEQRNGMSSESPPQSRRGLKPPLQAPATSISPHKPALPPKPIQQSPRNSFISSVTSTPFEGPAIGHPKTPKISPPLLPKGRNSLSIANAILANANGNAKTSVTLKSSQSSSGFFQASDPQVPTSPRLATSSSQGANTRSPIPTSPPRSATLGPNVTPPRPHSVFNLPKPAENNFAPRQFGLKGKSASLGRNVAPPPTSPTSTVGQFFSNKAATFAKMLPLDLNFGKSSPSSTVGAQTRPHSLSTPASFRLRGPQNFTSSQQVLARPNSVTTFSSNSPLPPPPPPRLRRKLSPINSLSPVSPTLPALPLSSSTVVEEGVVYAEVDKEKKWAARRLKEEWARRESEQSSTISVSNVSSTTLAAENDSEGVQASLVITINRDTSSKNVNVQSLVAVEKAPCPKHENDIVNSKADEPSLTSQSEICAIVEVKNGNILRQETEKGWKVDTGNSQPQCGTRNKGVMMDSWLGHYLSPSQSTPGENMTVESNQTHSQASDNTTTPEQKVEATPLTDNKSFLFSALSTVDDTLGNATQPNHVQDVVNSPKEVSECVPSSPEESYPHSQSDTMEKSKDKERESPEQLLLSFDSKIQQALSSLSNLSGVDTNSILGQDVHDQPPLSPLVVVESPDAQVSIEVSLQGRENEKGQAEKEEDEGKRRSQDSHSEAFLASLSSAIVRRRSWNGSADSSSTCESSSSSLTNLRDKSAFSSIKSNLEWVDEGDSPGTLGDIDSHSDAPGKNTSSEDVPSSGGFSFRRRTMGRIFRSFGKAGSSSTSSSSNSNGTQEGTRRQKEKTKSGISRPTISGPIDVTSIGSPVLSPPSNERKHSEREKSTVQFSPDVIDPSISRSQQRSSIGSIGELPCSGNNNNGPEGLQPETEKGDNESLCSISSASTTGTGTPYYSCQSMSCYEEILAELSDSPRKAFFTAREIFTSEQTFVDVLDLLTVDFPKAIRRSEEALKHPIIQPNDLDTILGGLPTLKRVNEELKTDLQSRISNWLEKPKLADVIVKNGPFLKLYAGYIKNFEKSTRKLDECCQNSEHFKKTLKDFECSDRCRKLGLKHFMLKPVQRMPQYRLLLDDYLKHLDESGCDYEDTKKALTIVTNVADHANEAIRLQVNAEKLMTLQNRLPGTIIMKADRQLLLEGELLKVCRKDLQPRFFALMNDCLLFMSYNVGAAKDLKLRNELPLSGMRVCLSVPEEYHNEFSVISTARSFNLVANSGKERDMWMKALNDAINENYRKRTCRTPEEEQELGKIAPVWIQDSRVTMCQICTSEFTVTFRRHHCRSCGKVVCGNCSGNQAPLQYLKNDAARVCDDCYRFLLDEFDKEGSSNEGLETSKDTIRGRFRKFTPNVSNKRAGKLKKHVPSRLELPANNSGSRISSYLHWKERKAWKRHWFVLMDRVLYIYAASEDIMAIRTIPVLGWGVDFQKSEGMDNGDSEAVFKLTHHGQNSLLFQADNSTLAEKWVSAMKEATVLT